MTGKPDPAAFAGFGQNAVAWFEGLEADNAKAYFDRTREAWQRDVRAPLEAMLAEAAAAFGGAVKIFRQNRDIRFSKDKTPYKTSTYGVVMRSGTEAGLYIEMSSRGLFAGTGYYQMAKDQLQRFREATAAERSGVALEETIDSVEAAGVRVGGEALSSAPRGFDKHHPRIRFLRLKDVIAGSQLSPGPALHGRGALDHAFRVWRAAEPLCAWLDRHVGPSTIPPEVRFGRGETRG